MKKQSIFSVTSRIKSFKHAFEGFKTLFTTEHNSWVHLTATVIVISLGFLFQLSTTEWCFILFSIGLVFVTEILNTSIEYLTDIVSPEYNEKAKKVKDLAAASVLCASLLSLVIGLIIFIPKLLYVFH